MAPSRDIADEPDWEEITTVEQFRARVGGEFGVIVIEDSARDEPVAHHPGCSFVRERYFVQKVIDGAGSSGTYYWAKSADVAAAELDARRCEHPADKLASG